jgi:hypothetical protein
MEETVVSIHTTYDIAFLMVGPGRGFDKGRISLTNTQIAGSTNKKLSTEARALEPAMRNGSDGTRSLTCITWVVLLLPVHLVEQHLVAVPIFINAQ